MDVSTYQFASLYSWYSWPNVILPIIGGYLMDRVFGIRLGTIIFAAFIIIGQVRIQMFRNLWSRRSAIDKFKFCSSGMNYSGMKGTSRDVCTYAWTV